MHDGPLLIREGMALGLGEEASVRLHPLWPGGWLEVRPGLRLTMREGSRVVGVAEVIEVVPAQPYGR